MGFCQCCSRATIHAPGESASATVCAILELGWLTQAADADCPLIIYKVHVLQGTCGALAVTVKSASVFLQMTVVANNSATDSPTLVFKLFAANLFASSPLEHCLNSW